MIWGELDAGGAADQEFRYSLALFAVPFRVTPPSGSSPGSEAYPRYRGAASFYTSWGPGGGWPAGNLGGVGR